MGPSSSESWYLTCLYFFSQLLITYFIKQWGFPEWHNSKQFTYQCRRCKRCRLDTWVGKITWSRKWQPNPVFLAGESREQRSLVGYSPWGCKESDMTEYTHTHTHTHTHTLRDRSETFCNTIKSVTLCNFVFQSEWQLSSSYYTLYKQSFLAFVIFWYLLIWLHQVNSCNTGDRWPLLWYVEPLL